MVICSIKWKIDGRNIKNEVLSREWTTHHTSELINAIGDVNGHVGRNIDGFQGVIVGFSISERNQERRMLLEFCDAKHVCIANTWLRKADKKEKTDLKF